MTYKSYLIGKGIPIIQSYKVMYKTTGPRYNHHNESEWLLICYSFDVAIKELNRLLKYNIDHIYWIEECNCNKCDGVAFE